MVRCFAFSLFVAFALPSFVVAQEQTDKKPHPQESLETAVPHAIKLLEDKNYKDLLDGYIPPDDLKAMKDAGTYELVVKRFGEGSKAKQLMQALKETQSLKPEFNEDKTRATFKSEKEDSLLKTRPMEFIKVDKRWYIK